MSYLVCTFVLNDLLLIKIFLQIVAGVLMCNYLILNYSNIMIIIIIYRQLGIRRSVSPREQMMFHFTDTVLMLFRPDRALLFHPDRARFVIAKIGRTIGEMM